LTQDTFLPILTIMISKSVTTRPIHYLLVSSVVVIVIGVSLAQYAPSGRQSSPPLAQSEKCADPQADTLDFDSFEFVLLFHEPSLLATPSYVCAYPVAEETVDTESGVNTAHLQRGPPRC
jgi:hypothetical protein